MGGASIAPGISTRLCFREGLLTSLTSTSTTAMSSDFFFFFLMFDFLYFRLIRSDRDGCMRKQEEWLGIIAKLKKYRMHATYIIQSHYFC